MDIKVGVIVPVYNTEKYIARCIESVLEQSYPNFRLILVDDASPDKAGSICDEYARKDNRITVLHQDNTGVTRARANGVALAEDCDYITFVDSDDTINVDALSHLVSRTSDDCDIVMQYKVSNIPDSLPLYEDQITSDEYARRLLYWKISAAPWGKLFRRTLFSDYTFDIPRDVKIGEDLIMNLRLTYKAQKTINVAHYEAYNYNIYDSNTTSKFVSTPYFEGLWHQLIVSSILDETERSNYIQFSIPVRLQKFTNFGGFEANNRHITKTDFYKDLRRDILAYDYPLESRRKLFFYTNVVKRYIYIMWHKYKDNRRR